MRGFTGAVKALHEHSFVALETDKDGEGCIWVEAVCRIDLRHMLIVVGEPSYHHVYVNAECVPHTYLAVGGLGGEIVNFHGKPI